MPEEPAQPEAPGDGPSRQDAELRPFRVAVAEAELADLKRRLAATRWPSELPGEAGTTRRTGWLGHGCAAAPWVRSARSASARMRFIFRPSRRVG